MLRTIYILLLTLCAMATAAQDLSIVSVSDGSYPDIMVRARIAESPHDTISIMENGAPAEFSMHDIESSAKAGDGRMYVFLVENSYSFFHNGVSQSVREAMLSLGDNISGADNANILLFGMPGRTVRYVSAAQTSDMRLLSEIAGDIIRPQNDSTYFDNDLIAAMEEAVDYSIRHKKPQQTVVLTVITRPLNLSNTREFSPDFAGRLAKSGIYLNVVMYESETQNIKRELQEMTQSTGGSVSLFHKDDLEGVLAQQIERMSKAKSRNSLREVMITFKASQEGAVNSFLVTYGSSGVRCEYSNPRKSGFLGKYPISISILIGLLVVLAAVVFYIRTRNKIIRKIDSNTQTHFKDLQRQNRQLRQEIEKYKRHPLSLAHSFDNIYIEETLIGSGKIVPKLVVDDREQQMVFKLNKFTMTLGRGEGCDIVIDNRTVSSHHATLTNEGGLFYITDNDSTNGIFVNDMRITKSKIQPKDRIRIGAVMATLVY